MPNRTVRFPCIHCDKACGVDTVECSICRCWIHQKCTNLSHAQFQEYSADDALFYCPQCLGRDDDGEVEYSVPLNKLVTSVYY